MENNYQEYLNSFAWSALKKVKLEQDPDCECCWDKAITVHHLSYERRWSETEEDIVSICERCHYECHHVNWYQIKNDEEILKRRFEEVREKFLKIESDTFEIQDRNILKNGVQLNRVDLEYLGESFILFDDGTKLYYFFDVDGNYDYSDFDDPESFFEYKKKQDGTYRLKKELSKKEIFNTGAIKWYETFLKVWDIKINGNYFILNNSIFYLNIELAWCDVKTFKILYNWRYFETSISKDKNFIFFNWKKQEGIEINSFEVLDWKNNISKDSRFVYSNYSKIDWADPNSFVSINDFYFKDKKFIYRLKIEDKRIIHDLIPFLWVDVHTFELINDNLSRDKNTVYYIETWEYEGEIKTILWVDSKTFELIDYNKIKGKNEFESSFFKRNCLKQECFAKDKNFIYYFNNETWHKLESSDSQTFQFINNNIAKDRNNVYLYIVYNRFANSDQIDSANIYKIEWIDSQTFEDLWNCFIRDKKYIYYYFIHDNKIDVNKIEWANSNSFIEIEWWFAKDKKHIFYKTNYWNQWKMLEWGDINTFEVLNERYAKDKNFVYKNWEKLEWVNPIDFNLTNYE